jgi:signal transduction histidine kinase
MDLNVLGIITWGISIANIILAIWVLIRNPRNPNNITYALVVLGISTWTISTYFYNNPSYLPAEQWLKIVYIASYFMLVTQAIFVYFFPRKTKDNFGIYFSILLLSAIPSIYVLIFQDSVVESVIHKPDEFISIATMGSGYLLYILPNTLGVIFLSIYFARKSRNFTGFEKSQIKFYILGALTMMIPIIIIDYFIPMTIGNTSLYIYGPIFVIPFTTSVAYSILTNRFLDLRSIIHLVFSFLSKALFIATLFYAYFSIAQRIFDDLYQQDAILFSLFLSPFVTYVIIKFFQLVDLVSKRLILKNTTSKEVIIQKITKQNSTELNLEKISLNVKIAIQEGLGVKEVGILLLDTSNTKILYKYLPNIELNGTRDLLEILHYWDTLGSDPILIADEVKREKVFGHGFTDKRLNRIIYFMDKYKISAVLPLNRQTQLNGVLLLGYKPEEIPFTVEEFNLLETVIANTSVAMGRALLYKQVEDFNNSLKEKVDEQTRQLQIKVNELQAARKKEADMIDIMGHELRTPATIVKLNADLLHNFVDKIPEDKESFMKYITRIKDAVENEINLINTLLSSAKLEGDKIEIKPEEVNTYKEIDMALHGEEKKANEKGIQLINNVKEDIPNVYADHARTVEVLNNLIGNAVKYTEKGSVNIYADSIGDSVKISIMDTGRGISKEEIANLGTKFFRTKTYIESEDSDEFNIVRPGGTGLGLYVSFNLIKKMGGQVGVSSELGKGSIFSFTLPKYTNQVIDNTHKDSNDMFARLGLKK